MSQFCPLCGKKKPEEPLFCDDCSRKMRTEYEVDIPEETSRETASPAGDLSGNEETGGKRTDFPRSRSKRGENKRIAPPLLFVLVIVLLTGAFFVYDETIRKNNLDRGGWDAAVKANSTEGYLAYMQAHPRGTHFDEAQAGLRLLKAEEAEAWNRMKETGNTAELRDFLNRHPHSPYVPLVKAKLDSLVWTGTLQTNTATAYSDYILMAEEGGVVGDYMVEAQKRYGLLSGSQSGNPDVLDSVRTTVDGFYRSLSTLNHSGMFQFLAPTVYRFFNSGAATRERITGELLVTGAQTEGTTLKFIPDPESVRYETTRNNHYKVNAALEKSYVKDGATARVNGYIVHLELNPLFQIVSIYETKPYPEAP